MQPFAVLVAAALTTSPQAPIENAPQAQEICLTIARYWTGSADDILKIEQIPVPESYLHYFRAGGCTRFQLVEESLVDWHFRFGNERTATAALAFLEADYLKGSPPPKAFATEVAESIERTKDGSGRAQSHLRELVCGNDKFVFLIQQYARAAEFYSSLVFFQKALEFYEPSARIIALLQGRAATSMQEAVRLPEWNVRDMRDLDERLSIMRARLSRSPSDIDRAQAILDSRFDPAFRVVLNEPLESENVCDLAKRPYHEELARSCDADPNFELTLTRFWVNQSQLDLLKLADPIHYQASAGVRPSGSSFVQIEGTRPPNISWASIRSADTAVQLLEPRRTEHIGGLIRTGREDRRIALYIAWADALSILATTARLEDTHKNNGPDEFLVGAMRQLEGAAALVRPSEEPERFRQIATRYAQLVDRYRAAIGSSEVQPPIERQAAYFRAVLAQLDQIKVGH